MTSRFLIVAGIIAASVVTGRAQDAAAAAQVKVEVKDVKVESQPTPQIQASNVVDKRWKPKTWLEIETDFDIKLPRAEGGNDGTYPSLEFKYHLMTSATKDGKRVMLEGTVTCINIPAHEKCHALAFVSPATLKRALMKDNGGKADIMGVAVEVMVGGQVVAGKGNPAGKWWEDASKYTVMDGTVLGKDKTPFAPFWGDYDVAPMAK